MTVPTAAPREPLLGEWACLGVLYDRPAHGWAVARQLRPDGDIGRIWHLSRPLTYRSIEHLRALGWIQPVGEEPGDAGPNRTVLEATRLGRSRFRTWVRTPVPHLRDLRSELLLKLAFAEQHRMDITEMLVRQRSLIDRRTASLDGAIAGSDAGGVDVVTLWRLESTLAAQRFLARLAPS